MNNSLTDLNNYLFEELERLNDDEELQDKEKLDKELKRAKAISSISTSIINNANTILDAQKFVFETGEKDLNKKLLLGNNDKEMD